MSEQEWTSFIDSIRKTVMLYAPYILVSLCITVCRYIDTHYGKHSFVFSKLILGAFSEVIYGMTLVTCTLWLTKGDNVAALAVLFVGGYRGRKWMDNTVDCFLKKRYGVADENSTASTNTIDKDS